MNTFPESDWKILSSLKPVALDRLCKRILQKASSISGQAVDGDYHKSYLSLYRHIEESDKVVARCFNDWRRSTAMVTLIGWRVEKLITEQEFQTFSEATRAAVNLMLS